MQCCNFCFFLVDGCQNVSFFFMKMNILSFDFCELVAKLGLLIVECGFELLVFFQDELIIFHDSLVVLEFFCGLDALLFYCGFEDLNIGFVSRLEQIQLSAGDLFEVCDLFFVVFFDLGLSVFETVDHFFRLEQL